MRYLEEALKFFKIQSKHNGDIYSGKISAHETTFSHCEDKKILSVLLIRICMLSGENHVVSIYNKGSICVADNTQGHFSGTEAESTEDFYLLFCYGSQRREKAF